MMIDALGFKGIWRRPGVDGHPEVVIDKLVRLRQEATQYLDRQFGGEDRRAGMSRDPASLFQLVHARFLSDTIVVAVAFKDPKDTKLSETGHTGPSYSLAAKVLALDTLCNIASAITAMGARTDPALAYRGCISFGDFEVQENFLVGPAVDEAAAANDLAQGAFVWFLPSALDLFMPFAQEEPLQQSQIRTYVSWEVPLKGGNTFFTYAISPVALAANEATRDKTLARIVETFAGGLDIQIKKQHTLRFLDACVLEWKNPNVHVAEGCTSSDQK